MRAGFGSRGGLSVVSHLVKHLDDVGDPQFLVVRALEFAKGRSLAGRDLVPLVLVLRFEIRPHVPDALYVDVNDPGPTQTRSWHYFLIQNLSEILPEVLSGS